MRDHGYDIVVAFGGDGTLNEVANGLAGTDVPVSMLPGGSTNVVCRTLGIPNDVVDATEHLLALADDWSPRKIDLGKVDDRHFVFACGVGIDATVVERVDAHPAAEVDRRPLLLQLGGHLGLLPPVPPQRRPGQVRGAGGGAEGVTAIVQNSDPFTYFANRPIRVCEGIAIDDGTLSVGVLKRATQRDMPTLICAPLQRRPPAARHRQVEHFDRRHRGHRAVDLRGQGRRPRPFPLQVDGDYIGDRTEMGCGSTPAP